MINRSMVTRIALALVVVALVAGCSPFFGGTTNGTNYKSYLYMTDTTNGRVYAYDPSKRASSATSLVTMGTKAAGEIKFYNGIGYVAMGTGGIYYFDLSAAVPSPRAPTGEREPRHAVLRLSRRQSRLRERRRLTTTISEVYIPSTRLRRAPASLRSLRRMRTRRNPCKRSSSDRTACSMSQVTSRKKS